MKCSLSTHLTSYAGFGTIDVRDVALAHSAALFTPAASGRHVLCVESLSFAEIAGCVHEAFPQKVGKPYLTVPRWLLVLIGPALGVPRDIVT